MAWGAGYTHGHNHPRLPGHVPIIHRRSSHQPPPKHTHKPVFDPDGYLRVLLGGPARLMQTKPPSDASLAALKAIYDWRDRVRACVVGRWTMDGRTDGRTDG